MNSIQKRARHLKAVINKVPALQQFGIRLVSLGRGKAIFQLRFEKKLAQFSELFPAQNALHGGVIAVLADTAATFASNMVLPEGSETVTIELKINYLRRICGGWVLAEATVLHKGQRTTVTSVQIRNRQEQLCAVALVTNLIYSGDRNFLFVGDSYHIGRQSNSIKNLPETRD